LFDFIGGGIVPANFLVDSIHNQINQKRSIEVIDLNNAYKKELKFTNNEIESYYKQNLDNFRTIDKTIEFVELNPNNLIGSNEFNDLFFKKLDEIDDLIVSGKNLDFLSDQFNLEKSAPIKFNEKDIKNKSKKENNFPNKLIGKIFSIDKNEPTVLVEHKDKYFVIEVIKSENFLLKISHTFVQSEILIKLSENKKRKLISALISKINNNNFKKEDFYKFSEDENVNIEKFKIKSKNDLKFFNQNLIDQIYSYGKNKVTLVADIALSEIYLIYIDKIENVLLDKNSGDYEKYSNLSKVNISNNLYNTYDLYLKKKYEININYKALDKVSNYFE
jgi:peptidyl-prolyl cis-trans isomerase D